MELRQEWIPLPDGVRLSVNLFLPDEVAAGARVPVLLEYLPYRKDDSMAAADWDLYSYVTRTGYAGARVDIRGTGRSEGELPPQEYSDIEWTDGDAAISWLAEQPWCTGAVGMWGISWGGFNSIQMAMRPETPDALRAIVALEATDMLFKDDVHYIDGMLHLDEYVIMIDLLNSLPPAPEFATDEQALSRRFDAEPWFLRWLREQHDGPFWQRGSLAPDYSRLKVPALLIGGWYDGYRDSVPRMLERCEVPIRAIVGPWNHAWPHDATPGPEIEWRHETARWWDRWLKNEDNGIEREPPFAVYVRDWYRPGTDVAEIPGAWRLEDGWPLQRLGKKRFALREDGSLADEAGGVGTHRLAYIPSAGFEAGGWWGELRPDMGPWDAASLVYVTKPLDEPLEILGFPRVELRASVDAAQANFFARICDVAPDGSVGLVAGAGMNGAHRESMSKPRPLEPGREETIAFDLHFTSWVFPAGHRIRLAVSNACWPMIWPSPSAMTMSLAVGEGRSSLLLPVIPHEDRPAPDFLPPEKVVVAPGTDAQERVIPIDWTLRREGRRAIVGWSGKWGSRFPWGRTSGTEELRFEVDDEDPAHASAFGVAVTEIELPGRALRWRGTIDLSSDETNFLYRYTRELTENGQVIRTKTWNERVPRDHQ
jgi:putative CocE/NonD family hydrolase